MKRLLLFVSLFAIAFSQVWAASQTITGTVLSAESGDPIIGAAVSVVGTTKGTITDVDGKFTLEVEEGATLRISFIGLKTVNAAAKNGMVVELEEDTEILDEVMVVGYGTTTRAQFVGSAKAVEGAELTKQASSDVTNTLQGKMAGVQVVNGSGQPGTGASIRIRGVGSINGGITPLYIVDGAPYDESSVNLISSYDIANITVLKDASATAIYGARGANGVVLITTKNGSTDSKFTVNVDAKWGNSQRAVPNYQVMTSPEMYTETAYKALFNSQYYNGKTMGEAFAYADKNIFSSNGLGYQVFTYPAGESIVGYNFKLNPNATLGYSDGTYYYTPDNWEKETLKTDNLRQEYNINVSGGNSDTQYFISAGYLSDPGIINGSSFKRFTTRAKVDSQVKKWLKVGAQMAYTYADYENPGYQSSWGSTANVFYQMNQMAPIYPFYVRNADGTKKVDANGYIVYDAGNSTNFTRPGSAPRGNNAINLMLNDNHAISDNFSGSMYLQLTPVEGLQITARVSPDAFNTRENSLSNRFYSSQSTDGAVEVTHSRLFALNQQYLIDYKKHFAEIHNIEVLAGWESYWYREQILSANNDHLYNPFIGELGNAYGEQPVSGKATSYTLDFKTAGFLARVQYDLMDRYFLNATYRFEGSSKFSPKNRWGHFGSIGAAWLINREGFLDNADWIDELKLKASWGTQGNDQIGSTVAAYKTYEDIFNVSYNAATGKYSTSLSTKGNPDLTWEKQMLSNVGVEFDFFKSRFGGSIEYFNRTNSNMLFSVTMPPSAGYASLRQNVGTVVNNGGELELYGVLVKTRNVTWSINANTTYIRSKIKELPKEYKENGWVLSSYIFKEGGSLVQGYLPRYAGVDPTTGQALYYVDPDKGDMSTTTNYESAKQADLGDLSVKFYGGFGTQLEAFGVDLSIQCAYQLGGKAYDGTYQELMHSGKEIGRNWHVDILKAWTPENPNTDVPRICSSDDWDQQVSDRWLVSSNYLSLNNITLGYTLPTKITKKAHLQKVRFFFQGDNLGLLSARQGFDPRQGQNAYSTGLGISTDSGNFVYSLTRTLSGGVSLSF